MKTKILIIFTIFSVQPLKSQIFSKKSSWTTITTNRVDHTFSIIHAFTIDGDTLLGDKNYSKVFRDNELYSALRESEDNKVYAYILDLEKELLIYDFNWYPNKVLYFQNTGSDDFHIRAVLGSEIDSIQLLDGKYYQYIRYDDSVLGLIRGIGDTRGFFISTFPFPTKGDQYALLRFYIDDTLVYNRFNFVTSVDDPLPSNPLSAYAHHGLLHLTGLTAGETINIYNVSGALVYQSIATSDNANIPLNVKGVYIVKVGNRTVKVVFE